MQKWFKKYLPLPLLIISLFSAFSSGAVLQPIFDGNDLTRTQIRVGLISILSGLDQPTDIQFLPTSSTQLVITEKTGKVKFFDLKTGKSEVIGKFQVYKVSELGVLGFAFHPKFPKTSKVYLNYNPEDRGPMRTRVSEFQWVPGRGGMASEHVLLEVKQPFANHDAGQLAFGPDGKLYIGFGDGGSADDPQNHAQNKNSLLGKMLRIGVDKKSPGLAYEIPTDNPFVADKSFRPEIFAWGLRNPWRYSFDGEGRMIAGDVGQNLWEEITFVPRGANLGWKIAEASHCFSPKENCPVAGLTPPIAEYGREDGVSVTGGYPYTGAAIPELKGKYVFGDFGSGRLWAIAIPKTVPTYPPKLEKMDSLGRWAITVSTFGRDAAGELYLADFGTGIIYAIKPVK